MSEKSPVISKQHIIAWFQKSAEVMKANKALLTDLDAAIGDADHGRNMERGYEQARLKIGSVADKDIGTILKTMGMVFMSKLGGAGGQLYANCLLRAADTALAKEELTPLDVADMLDACVEGIFQRGRAELGEKTMIDAWTPAAVAMRLALSNNATLHQALQASIAAAQSGMEATVPMQARKGRASYLGERSIGHQDPGATSSYLILQTLLDVYEADE